MGNKIHLKEVNRNKVYKMIYNSDGICKQDIAYKLKLSLPTVSQNITELKNRGLIEEKGTFESTGGRRARVIKCVDDVKTAIGMDITRNHVSLVMVDLKGKILSGSRKRITFEDTEEFYQSVGVMVDEFVEATGLSSDRILGMGISLPAIIGEDKKSITYISVLPAPSNLYERLVRYIKYNFLFSNDANAGGFAEFWRRDSQDPIVYVSLSNSVGGSIMYSDSTYYGQHFKSGEFGHMTLVPEGRMCYCGKKGCADAYCNAKILANLTNGNLKDFFNKIEKNDKTCTKVFHEYLYYLGQLVYNLRMIFDCDVVLGGYVGSHMEKHLQVLAQIVDEKNPFEKGGDYIKVCNYKFEASAAGAALYYIDKFIDSI